MSPFKHPVVSQMSHHDLEREAESKKSTNVNVTANADGKTSPAATDYPSVNGNLQDFDPTPVPFRGKLVEWNEKVEGRAGLEARGIHEFCQRRSTEVDLVVTCRWFNCGLAST